MPPEVVQLVGQLGFGGVILWLLIQERQARADLERRIFEYLDRTLEDLRAEPEAAS